MRIGLTYDLQTDATDERQAEFDPPATIAALRAALESFGHEVIPLGNAHDLLRASEAFSEVEIALSRHFPCGASRVLPLRHPMRPRRAAAYRASSAPGAWGPRLRVTHEASDLIGRIDLVFNIAEGTHGRCREAWVPTLLELHGVPYVGSDPLALMLGLDKAMSKRLAIAAGIPTPRWISVEDPAALPSAIPLEFPVIVKPRFEGSGRGIDAGAIVRSREALDARVRWLFEWCWQPVLIEEFIPHGELTVWLIGNTPPQAYPPIQRPLDPATRLSCHVVHPTPSVGEAPLVLDEPLEARARQMALAMFETLGCHDLARIDLRVDEEGQLYFLEINPLPSFDPAGGLGLLAESLGIAYSDLVGRILDAALTRLRGVGGAHIQPAFVERVKRIGDEKF